MKRLASAEMTEYLSSSEAVNSNHPSIVSKAKLLANGLKGDEAIAKRCFEFVRDEIEHSGDNSAEITTYKASEVLEHKTGWCYAKSHLLAALLRANNIPTGLCYQRLSQGERGAPYCLHGLNAIYLKAYGWYRVDARGNKKGVNAQFNPPLETLAFAIQDDNEGDFEQIYVAPLPEVAKALQCNANYKEMTQNFPDRVIYNSSNPN